MKKIGILNSEISKVISELGHTDKIVICDSGLPIPSHVKRIDLALKKGVPSFIETIETVLVEMHSEQAYVAVELEALSPEMKRKLDEVLTANQIPVTQVGHEQLKELSKEAKAIIRTGEFTPYANIILEAGVIF